MTSTLAEVDGPGDAELISAVRGGDVSAYGDLFARHVDAARRLARQLTNPSDADDLVSDAFAKVLRVLQKGGGPDLAFRAYLLTSVRRLHVDRIRATSKLHTTDDLEPFDPGVPFRDTVVEGFENAAAAKAFASLPERWQLVLWHTEVEGQKPAEVAELLGMSPNSVSALAYRAREGLRQAFLNSHAEELEDAQCRWTHEHLGGYVRHGLARRDCQKVEKHLDECRGCMAIYLELTEVNSNLGAILAPLLLGSAAGVTYLAGATGSVAIKGGLLVLLGRVRDVALANTQVLAISSVATVTAVAGVSLAVTSDNATDAANITAPGIARTVDQDPAPSDPAPSNPAAPPPVAEVPVIPAPVAPHVIPELTPPEPTSSTPESPPASVESTVLAPTEPEPAPQQPSPTPTPEPEPEPEPEPTIPDPTAPPVEHDLQLAGTSRPLGLGGRTEITATTNDYAPQGTATLTLRSNRFTLGRAPRECTRVSRQVVTCPLSSDKPTVRIVLFLPLLAKVTMSVAADNFTDADPGNNNFVWKSVLLP